MADPAVDEVLQYLVQSLDVVAAAIEDPEFAVMLAAAENASRRLADSALAS